MEDDEFDLEDRIIRLTGEIDEALSEKFVKALHAMCNAEKAPVTVVIHSCGGGLEDGFRIIDAIGIAKAAGCPVNTVVTGKAYSMAAIILCLGDRRTAYPNARIMFHSSRYEEGDMPTSTKRDIKDMYNELAFYDGKFCEILSGLSLSKKLIRTIMAKDYYIDTPEAIHLGIVQETETKII